MIFKNKKIVYLLAAIYTLIGFSLLYNVYNMGADFLYSRQFIIRDLGNLEYMFTKLGICILIVLFGTSIVVAVVVRFAFKKPDYISAVIYSLIVTVVFGEICLLTVYLSHSNYGDMLRVMRANSKVTNNTINVVPAEWSKFQKNMKCCGVSEPLVEYSNSKPLLPTSCCVQNSATILECNVKDSYQIGCYTKFLANFQEKNQRIIFASIVFNVFTMMAMYLIRQSSLFVVKIDSNKIIVEFNN